ncbi:MAG: hypothetical protein ACOZIN_05125 [Myxococcota bacterium]
MNADGGYPVLSRRARALVLGVVVLFFLVGLGPVWEHPWDVDGSILYSYLPIPFLVAALLASRRRWAWKGFWLHTLEVTAAKFVVTASVLVATWVLSGSPPRVSTALASTPGVLGPALPKPSPTPIAPESTGVLSGRVVGADGEGRAGVLVWVAQGLEGWVFATPKAPVVLENSGQGFLPHLTAVQVGQPLVLRSGERRLHTGVAAKEKGGWVANIPALAGGGASFAFREPYGVVRVRCAVHREAEEESQLVVLAHPFFIVTGPGGRFRLEGVPAGKLMIEALLPPSFSARAEVELFPGGQLEIGLALPRS